MRDRIGDASLLARLWPAAGVSLTTAALVLTDLSSEPGKSWGEIFVDSVETALLVSAVAGVGLLAVRFRKQQLEHALVLRDLELARAEGAKWRAGARDLINGLADAIDHQFDVWDLTPAEREVAFLLLKGLSLRELAEVRSTSERTVRQQARSVYRKAGLSGRAALSAFFLEDLLAPADERAAGQPPARRRSRERLFAEV